jgi:hypothetical protein
VATLTSISETMTGTMREWANLQKSQLDAFSEQLASFARASGTRLDGVRAESATGAKQLREEVVATLRSISETITDTMSGMASAQKSQFEGFANQLASFAQTSGEKLDGARAESATGAKGLREEVVTTLNSISETMAKTIKDLAVAEKVQLEAFSEQIAAFAQASGERLDGVRAESATGAKQLREEVVWKRTLGLCKEVGERAFHLAGIWRCAGQGRPESRRAQAVVPEGLPRGTRCRISCVVV